MIPIFLSALARRIWGQDMRGPHKWLALLLMSLAAIIAHPELVRYFPIVIGLLYLFLSSSGKLINSQHTLRSIIHGAWILPYALFVWTLSGSSVGLFIWPFMGAFYWLLPKGSQAEFFVGGIVGGI